MYHEMFPNLGRVLITEEELRARIKELGQEVARDYADKNPVFLGVLKGVVHFFADMTLATPIRCQYDFLAVSSYANGHESTGNVVITKDITTDIQGRHVVILEDILDTGLTLQFVTKHLLAKGPASLKIVTLLDKPERRTVDLQADYVGFTIPNLYVMGYGLDDGGYCRNLPFIGVAKSDE